MSWDDKAIGEYAGDRLRSGRDDRCDKSKLHNDAVLRGQVGARQANEIIDAIDKMKMRR